MLQDLLNKLLLKRIQYRVLRLVMGYRQSTPFNYSVRGEGASLVCLILILREKFPA